MWFSQKLGFRAFFRTRNYGALRAPPLLAPARRGHYRFHVYNGPCPPKKIWSWPTFEGLEAAGGSWGSQRPSGTTRDQCCGQMEPFEPKKNFSLGRPLMASRPLEGSGGAGHHQGPSGIDAGVKRNHLSQKKNSASAGLRWPLEATRGRDPDASPKIESNFT